MNIPLKLKNKKLWLSFLGAIFLSIFLPQNALTESQECNSSEFADRYVIAYRNAQPLRNVDAIARNIDTIAKGQCHQAEVVKQLTEEIGQPIGYKVALTNKNIQTQLGIDQPVVGVLLEKMLLPDGISIPVNSGGRLIYEADLLVKIKNDKINKAKNIKDIARHVESVIPFIEVPDIMLAPGERLTAELLVAMNASARWGVVGESIIVKDEVEEEEELLDAIANLEVEIFDESGKPLANGKGTDILSHPFNSLLFLVQELRSQGKRLEEGEIVSLGSFGRFNFAEAGKTAIVNYYGLPGGNQTIVVKFHSQETQ